MKQPLLRGLPSTHSRVGRPAGQRALACLGAALTSLLALTPAFAQPTALVLPGLEVGTEGVDPGEVLLDELNCVACHTTSPSPRQRLSTQPAPVLGHVATRVRLEYLSRFLSAPHREKPGTLMPDLLHGRTESERAQTVEGLTHFLASLTAPATPEAPSAEALELAEGRLLYHRTGCVACHPPQEPAGALFPDQPSSSPSDPDSMRYVLAKLNQTSVPLGDLQHKYLPGGLARFLSDPLAVRPAGRMPRLNLTESEARAIAAHLQREVSEATPLPVSAGRAPPVRGNFVVRPAEARRGSELFATLGCAACHELGGGHPRLSSQLQAPHLDRLRTESALGCLSDQPSQGAPRFLFSTSQLAALRSVLARPGQLGSPRTARERVASLVTALNCYACHSRDGYGGPSPSRADYFVTLSGADLGDEGRLPPHLTEVGNKLRAEWLNAVLTNRGVVRPYMATRMPQFGATNVIALGSLLLQADLPPQASPAAGPLDGDLPVGRRLTGTNGYACVSCHSFGPYNSLGISVMDMTQMAKRLRHDWFYRYLLDPTSLRPGTRMPAFWPEGKPSLTDVLEGDTARQINAIWAFLSRGAAAEPPPGLTEAEKTGAGTP